MVQQPAQPNLTIRSALSAVISRVVTIALFAAAAAYLIYRDNMASFVMGKTAWLADQSAYYDRTLAHAPGLLFLILAVILMGLILGAYELVALVIRKLLAEPILKALFPAE